MKTTAEFLLTARLTRASSIPLPFLLSCGCRLQNLEGTHKSIIHSHHCSGIVKFTTVVGRRENRYKFSPSEEFITVFDHLMRSHDEIKIMFFKKFLDNFLSKCE